jgi:hypothetical protein
MTGPAAFRAKTSATTLVAMMTAVPPYSRRFESSRHDAVVPHEPDDDEHNEAVRRHLYWHEVGQGFTYRSRFGERWTDIE